MHAYLALCLATGSRTEEARKLRWEHVDFGDPDARRPAAASAAVWRSVRAHGGHEDGKSRRTLGLPEMAADALRAHKKRQAGERLAAGAERPRSCLLYADRRRPGRGYRPAGVQGGLQGREDRGALDATGAASFIRVTDVQFGSARGGDRPDSGALELEDD